MYASVVIDNSSSNVDIYYEYEVPSMYTSYIKKGERCIVSFGNGNRHVMGYIIDVYDDSKFEGEIKPILELLDYEPVISLEQLELALFIKDDVICPLSRILNLMIPEVLRGKTKKYLTCLSFDDLEAPLAPFFMKNATIPFSKELEAYTSAISRAREKKTLAITYDVVVQKTDKTVKKYKLNQKYYLENIDFVKSKRQKEILKKIYDSDLDYLTKDALIDQFEISEYAIDKLTKEGFFKIKKVIVRRVKDLDIEYKVPELNHSSQFIKDYDQMIESEKGPFVWVSGGYEEDYEFLKYLSLKNKAINKVTLIVVPNILASYKVKTVIRKLTKLDVACLNSKLPPQEVCDYYEMIKKGEFDVVVTTPFAALWPYDNVKTIVMMDVENDSYRNDQSPRYDLTIVMKKRCSITKTTFIGHMVTPTLKEYAEVMLNHACLLEKKQDIVKKDVKISVVDMKKTQQSGNNTPVSYELKNALEASINNKKHNLLILNNRGYSKFVMCRDCGEILECPSCHTPFQYHLENAEKSVLKCPICNKKEPFLGKCPKCGSSNIRHIGYGMERLKEYIEDLIPSAKCAILAEPKFEVINDLMLKLADNEINTIIASDVYSRSLIDNDIAVVGIIALDLVAGSPNYNAHDVAYSMLEHARMQLAPAGELIIQTFDTKYNFLIPFITDDYNAYFDNEIALRNILKTEPIYEVNRIIVKDDYPNNFKIAEKIKKALYEIRKNKPLFVMGPTYNKTDKAVQLTIKHQDKTINEVYKRLYRMFQQEKTTVIFDRYPKYFV